MVSVPKILSAYQCDRVWLADQHPRYLAMYVHPRLGDFDQIVISDGDNRVGFWEYDEVVRLRDQLSEFLSRFDNAGQNTETSGL